MITKIFYSLVLFPIIKYDEPLINGIYLIKILEEDIGLLKLVLLDSYGNEKYVFFKHKNFLFGVQCNIQNWYLYGDVLLVKYVINKLYKIDSSRDFNFYDKKELNNKRPFGVVLSITSKCNIFCYYCFNDVDYDLKGRNAKKDLGIVFWKTVIDQLYDNGTRVVIVTGGEPMISPFFWDLLDYLKQKNIFIHLNTNGTILSDKNLIRLNLNYSLNIMVSMHEFNDEDYYKVNQKGLENIFGIKNIPERFRTMFFYKVTQLRKINKLKNLSLEFLTILVWKNILNLDKIYRFSKKSGINIHSWQFFRLYKTKNNMGATSSMMKVAIDKMYSLNNQYGVSYKIVDPVPFCVTKNIEKAKSVIDGVLSDTHDIKTIITTDGYIQLMSAYDNNFWNIKNVGIDRVFQSEFVRKQLNNGFLPIDCKDCLYKNDCRGGSRMDANIYTGSYNGLDPLSNLDNKVKL